MRIRVQPAEGISISFASKMPGPTLEIERVRMDFRYATAFDRPSPEAYERLLLDAIHGDSTLFARNDEVELSWELVDAIIAGWRAHPGEGPHAYEAGTWGPAAADALLAGDGRTWYEP
jgi:glucose-6-phosphate 1-dehydrogenase